MKDANKGGLIIAWQSIQGFLPASQLKPEHYPRVANGEKQLILDELKKLIGTNLSVSIITADPREGKLIFSERGNAKESRETLVDRYAVGDTVEGVVTGIGGLRHLRESGRRTGRPRAYLGNRLGLGGRPAPLRETGRHREGKCLSTSRTARYRSR